MPDDSVTFEGVSFEALALQQPLRFPAPMAELGSDYPSFEFHWKLLLFVFEIDDPRVFPRFPVAAFSVRDLEVLRRFTEICEALAASALLASSARVTVRVDRIAGTEEVVKEDYPSKDSVAGFLVLFRQLYSADEPASFNRAYGILERVNQSQTDPTKSVREDEIRRWRKAHGRLRSMALLGLVATKLMAEGMMISGQIPSVHDLNPEELVSLFAYGDLIHWGEKRNDLAAFGADKLGAVREHDFLKVVSSIAHFYAGFGVLVGSAIADAEVGS